MDNHFLSVQNKKDSLILLAVQRHLYAKAKMLSFLNFLLSVVLELFLAIIRYTTTQCFQDYSALMTKVVLLASLLIGLVDYCLREYISKLKKKAAQFQELFDHKVIGVEWNELLVGGKPSKSYISINTPKEYDTSGLTNWYNPRVSEIHRTKVVLMCQLINCIYDSELKIRYHWFVRIISLISCFIVVITSLIIDISLASFVVLVAQIMPVIMWYLRFKRDMKEYTISIDRTKEHIERHLGDSRAMSEAYIECIFRRNQDRIYTNRTHAFLIPDWFYRLFRKRNESIIDGVVNSYTNNGNNKE